jgi:hypothetical protein
VPARSPASASPHGRLLLSSRPGTPQPWGRRRTCCGSCPPEQVVEWLEQAANALDDAHAAGVMRRDVKPANLLPRHRRLPLARAGTGRAGNRGERPLQPRGGRVRAPRGRAALRLGLADGGGARHATDAVPSISSVKRELPATLDPVFRRALAKDPAARYASAAAFVRDLRAALQWEEADAVWVLPTRSNRRRRSRESLGPRSRGRRERRADRSSGSFRCSSCSRAAAHWLRRSHPIGARIDPRGPLAAARDGSADGHRARADGRAHGERVENEKLGPVSDQAKTCAAEAGREALDHGKQVVQAGTARDEARQHGEELSASVQEKAREVRPGSG